MTSSSRVALTEKHLRCPSTGQGLHLMDPPGAAAAMGFNPSPLRTNGIDKAKPVGATELLLVRDDNLIAYPVVGDTPILLAPEALGDPALADEFDLDQPSFQEAYLEMDFYNRVGSDEANNIVGSEGWQILDNLVRLTNGAPETLLEPPEAWLDAVFDSASQADAYEALQPTTGRRFAQIGGKGIHAVKFLLAGAAEAWILTPMLGEARCAIALAQHFGVAERLHTAVCVAEQIPIAGDYFDGIFVGGSVHHMETSLAMPEILRVMAPDGAFGAVEPFRAPLYSIGTRVFGKREANAHCTPLDADRIQPFLDTFKRREVVHHGALTRYPLLALWKVGLSVPFSSVWRINRADDRISDALPRLRDAGSSVCLLGWK